MEPRLLLSLLALPACAFAQVARVPSPAYLPGSPSGAPLGNPAAFLTAPSSVFQANLPLSPAAYSLPSLPSVGAAPAPVRIGAVSPSAFNSLIERAGALDGSMDETAQAAPAVHAVAAAELPPYLTAADAEDRRWIEAALNAASKSRTARRILSQVAAMSKAQGRPVMVEFAGLRSSDGEYVYDWGMLRMASRYKRLAPQAAAPVFIHELLHAVQRFHRLPTDAVEMELEAHVVTIQVARELGFLFPKNDFSREAERLLRKSPEAFIRYVASFYSDDLGFGAGQTMAAFERRLFDRHARSTGRILRLESALSRRQATLKRMKESGQPEDEVRSYERDIVEPAAAELRREEEKRSRIGTDLILLRDPASQDRYRNYARRVMALIRRAHLQLRRDP